MSDKKRESGKHNKSSLKVISLFSKKISLVQYSKYGICMTFEEETSQKRELVELTSHSAGWLIVQRNLLSWVRLMRYTAQGSDVWVSGLCKYMKNEK